jgi:hypothetical protein
LRKRGHHKTSRVCQSQLPCEDPRAGQSFDANDFGAEELGKGASW